jgi:hypothetical protein
MQLNPSKLLTQQNHALGPTTGEYYNLAIQTKIYLF